MAAFMHAPTKAALVPNRLTPARFARSHNTSSDGCPGLPSYSTGTPPTIIDPMRKFHIIQPVVVNHDILSPGRTSNWRPTALACSRTMPPWPWTIAFGRPVVPDEYSTQSGWSNGTASNVRGSDGPAANSDHDISSAPAGVASTSRYGMRMVRLRVGSAARRSSMTGRRSNDLSPYV